jgi:ADP-heptose:LPS heptosyltransferase
MRLALLRLSALGDILRVLPAWVNLHDAFPDSILQAVVEDRHAFLLEPFPWLQPVTVRRKALSNPLTAMAELNRVGILLRGADASLDFHGILKAALIPRLAGIPERWGDGVTKEGAGWLQNRRLPFQSRSRYSQALGLSEAFGLAHGVQGLDRFRPVLRELPLPAVDSVWIGSDAPRVILVPGASRRGAIKRWPMLHWIRLAALLKGKGELRWSLGPDEESLRSWLPEATGVPALPRSGMWELASMLRTAQHVVSPDTGLLHLSILLGVPVTALFGPSDPVVAGLPNGTGRILRTGLACSPCRERACLRLQCLEELAPEQVAEELPL